jgi:hypothetical protein
MYMTHSEAAPDNVKLQDGASETANSNSDSKSEQTSKVPDVNVPTRRRGRPSKGNT